MGVITSDQLYVEFACYPLILRIVSNTEKHAVMTQEQRLYIKADIATMQHL